MGISSLGVGSSILTQDVLDQLRQADEAGVITPIKLNIANEEDKKKALSTLDAIMTNLADSVNELATPLLYDERTSVVTGTSVDVVAQSNTDIQAFTLDVINIATKQIEESGSFAAITDTIATAAGSMNLNIDGLDFSIAYDATTTLDNLKDSINDIAGDKVNATIVQIAAGDFRLIMSSVDTGTTQDITMTDTGGLKDARLTTGVTALQTGVDANFTFNGQAITRSSNNVSDLIVGLDITLKSVGSSDVSVEQDREGITSKIDSFVEKYNSAMTELDKLTKSSTASDERGIFSSESTIKSMKRTLQDMIGSAGGGVASMYDFGFDVDRDGKLSIDKDVFNTKLDDNSANVEAFFGGGTYINADLTTTVLTGAFVELSVKVEDYTKYNATLDQFKDSITSKLSSLEDKKLSVTERLDAKYEIMKKQFAAYDLIISKFNSASSTFIQLANAQTAAQNS